MNGTMRALVLGEHGELDALRLQEDYPRPELVPGHVVLRVTASSFNYHDIFTVAGMPGITLPLPVVIGLDIAGTVEEIADDVDGWAVGDRVMVHPLTPDGALMGEALDGGMAELALVDARQLIRIPDAVSDVQAAALPVAYGTAHRMVVGKGAIHAGDKVLVLGASGGVGTASVVLAKRLGAHVVAAAGTDAKAQALLDLGADEVLNYRTVDFSRWVKEHYGKPSRTSDATGMDVVINFTGGDTWHPTLRSTKLGGRILVCGATAGYDPVEDLRYIWSFELQVIGSNGFQTEDFEALLAMVAAGELDPLVSDVVPLSGAVEGLRKVRDREVLGKIVVTPGQGR
ncbi:quinone oxidoreductase family protein [Georgenia faecalis]|uniref:quinone oxidoreductase family protein n=1 Tax=Georgenia faecalis TaxID=2483799 RepID=UPI000FD9F9BB|nr:zinc-binding dehydrogenase [Georgenia faecalis]